MVQVGTTFHKEGVVLWTLRTENRGGVRELEDRGNCYIDYQTKNQKKGEDAVEESQRLTL